MLITCPICHEKMDYYAEDATCFCIQDLVLFDVWEIDDTGAAITEDMSDLYLCKDSKGMEYH